MEVYLGIENLSVFTVFHFPGSYIYAKSPRFPETFEKMKKIFEKLENLGRLK
jgi:hypothetical protein